MSGPSSKVTAKIPVVALPGVDLQSESDVSSFTKESDKNSAPNPVSNASRKEIEELKRQVDELNRAEEKRKIKDDENAKYNQSQLQRIENLENRVAALQLTLMKSGNTVVSPASTAIGDQAEKDLDLGAYGLTKACRMFFL